MGDDDEDRYDNVRQIPGIRALIGERLLDVTQEDREEFDAGERYIALHFGNGTTIRFDMTDEDTGFTISELEDGEDEGGDPPAK